MKVYAVIGEERGNLYLLGIGSSPEAARLIGNEWTANQPARAVKVSAYDMSAEMRAEKIGTVVNGMRSAIEQSRRNTWPG